MEGRAPIVAWQIVLDKVADGHKSLDGLISYVSGRIAAETAYARSLDKLSNFDMGEQEQGTLKEALERLAGDLSNKSTQHSEYARSMNEEVLQPLRSLRESLAPCLKKMTTEGRRMHRAVKTQQDRFRKAASRFERAWRDVGGRSSRSRSQHKASLSETLTGWLLGPDDSGKKRGGGGSGSGGDSGGRSGDGGSGGSSGGSGGSGRRGLRSPRSSAEMEADLQSKIDAVGEKSEHVREVGSDCMASWKEFVRAQNVYAADMKAFLESFHMDEERRVEEMRVSLRKSLVFESSLQANLQYDVQSLAAPMEAIDCHADLQAFLSSHHEELRAEGVDVDTVGRGVEMRATIDRLFHGDVPDLESYVLLRRDVRDSRDSMLDFISALDQQRGKGVYLVEDAFDMVAQLINDALSKAEETMDFSSGRALMIISQTFCKRVREESKDVDTAATAAEDATAAATAAAVAGADGSDGEQVVYLQLRIAKHSLWRNMEFWEKALFDSLSQEMSKIHKAAAEERVARESDIAFGQLGFFALNMLTFGVSEASVRKLLHKFNMVIQLDDMLWTELLANLRATAQRRRQAAAAAAREAEEAEAAAAAVDGSRPPTMPLPATPADAKTAAKKKRKKKGSKKRRKSASRPPADAADDATPPPPPPRDAAGDAAGDGSADEAASRPPPPPPRRSS